MERSPLPALHGVVGTQASGISFQQWGSVPASNGQMTPNGGPHRLIGDEPVGADHIHIAMTGSQPKAKVGQRVIIPTHQIEETITGVSGSTSDLTVYLANDLTVPIVGTASTAGDIVCYITDRVSYNVVSDPQSPGAYKLQWTNTQGTRDIVSDITNPRPFSIPTTPAGALYYRFVAAIDLSPPTRSTASAAISRRTSTQRTGSLSSTPHYLPMKNNPASQTISSSLIVVVSVLATLMVIVRSSGRLHLHD